MLRPLSTLPLPKSAISALGKSGYHYVEDVENFQDWAHNYDEKVLNPLPSTISALDLYQDDLQQDYFTTLCKDLDDILDGGIQCGFIMEICGAYGSGKTQICLQTSVTSQLPEECGGLNAHTLYIDTRNGFCPSRVREIIGGCRKFFPNVAVNEADMMNGIKVSSAGTCSDVLSTIDNLNKQLRHGTKMRVLVIDSLSLPVQCAHEDGFMRTQIYSNIMNELRKITVLHKIAVIVVNELCSNIDADGKITYESAGGQIVAHRAHKRLVVARLDDTTFAARILKSSTIPQISIKFRISGDGVRDETPRA